MGHWPFDDPDELPPEFTPVVLAEFSARLVLLEHDIASTIGEAYRHEVGSVAENARQFARADGFVEKVVEDVQQIFMDTFVDTTWPSCPRHPNHPLWFHDDAWYCDRDGVALASLGELVSIGAGATGRAALLAREVADRKFSRRNKPPKE